MRRRWSAGSRFWDSPWLPLRGWSWPPSGACPYPAKLYSQDAINAYVVLVGVQAVLAHANLRLNFGWLEYVLVTPFFCLNVHLLDLILNGAVRRIRKARECIQQFPSLRPDN